MMISNEQTFNETLVISLGLQRLALASNSPKG